ncbi:MAG TPA: TldD/PmbA family protein, partial [Casimicrobiaceae bacterium]|nr:TldD/PmbA family protein [Casimicrobiaceae bacterium]
ALDDSRTLPRPAPRGDYASPSLLSALPTRREWYELLQHESEAAGCDPRIVDWEALVDVRHATHRLVTSEGGDVLQRYRFLFPSISVTAHADDVTQQRSLNGYRGICQQGGIEILARFGFTGAGARIAQEALELLAAPNCPSGRMDVLLAPDQMVLQIHESIGHPLELDRILGDERNFAGTSFVTPDMFGNYRYGSEHLDITFDPTRPEELASYAYDDDGTPADRTYLIRDGILERPLGGAISQARAGLPGVANARADNWNRPPIDRMANLNLEPGDATLDELVAGIERGVLLETNSSWSIDDSRNKFQFGCERGRLIEDGRIGAVVKNPNYRGISAVFWRSLARVGNADTLQVLGTPFCGKGEPGQTIRVGHASPACVFTDVDVFGGES